MEFNEDLQEKTKVYLSNTFRPTFINVMALFFFFHFLYTFFFLGAFYSRIGSYLHCDIYINHLCEYFQPFQSEVKSSSGLLLGQELHIYKNVTFFVSLCGIESAVILASLKVNCRGICCDRAIKQGICSPKSAVTNFNK